MIDFLSFPSSIAGMMIIEDDRLVDTTEDWSRVRSPSRAERRRRQGHHQNIRFIHTPKQDCFVFGNTCVVHPQIVAQLRAAIPSAPGQPSASTSGSESVGRGTDTPRPFMTKEFSIFGRGPIIRNSLFDFTGT